MNVLPAPLGDIEEALIQPRHNHGTPRIGPIAVMASSSRDLPLLSRKLQVKEKSRNHLMSRLHFFSDAVQAAEGVLIGPMIGAPYATILMEDLIAWGARKIIFTGWCGSLVPSVRIGDLLIPSAAYSDEGTSAHYGLRKSALGYPSPSLLKTVTDVCVAQKVPAYQGKIWTTDAIYRETHAKIACFRQKQALAVEMELSALFAVGAYRDVEVVGLLIVSDDLSSGKWRPGFNSQAFKKGRHRAAEAIRGIIQQL